MDVREVQLSNANGPIILSLSENLMKEREVQPRNASCPILVTPSGTENSFNVLRVKPFFFKYLSKCLGEKVLSVWVVFFNILFFDYVKPIISYIELLCNILNYVNLIERLAN